MQLKNSFIKLGLMASFVALLFISCKKDDGVDKPIDEVDDKVGTATASIKIEDQETVKFELVPVSDYEKIDKDEAVGFPLAKIASKGNFFMFLTNDINLDDDGPGMKLFFYSKSIEEGKEYAFAEQGSDFEVELDENDNMIIHKGNVIGFIPPQAEWTTVFQTIENNENTGSGILKITSLTNDRIKGAFSANMHNLKGERAVISEGKFDLPLVREK